MNTIKGKELADIIPLTARSQWQEGRQEVCMTYPELLEFSQAIISQVAPQAPALPKGWRIMQKPTCFSLIEGNCVIANLVGPDAEKNAAIIVRCLATPPASKAEPIGEPQ